MSYEKSFYQVFKCFSSDKFDYDEDAVLFASKSLGDCHNFAYQLWIEREDDNVFVTIIQPCDGSCRGGYGFPDEEEKPSEIKQLQAENAALRAEAEHLQMALADTEALELGTAERCKRLQESYKMQEQQLAASQLEEKRLREALEELTGVWYGKTVSDIALKALSTLKESENN